MEQFQLNPISGQGGAPLAFGPLEEFHRDARARGARLETRVHVPDGYRMTKGRGF